MPLIPKLDTAVRTTRSAGSGTGSVSSRTPPDDQSTCGVGSATCRVTGRVRCSIALIILITPATPAAAWVCPMFDFTEPSQSGRSATRLRP